MPEVMKCKVRLYEKKNEMPDYFFPHNIFSIAFIYWAAAV